MQFRVKSWSQIFLLSALTTLLAVAVPVGTVFLFFHAAPTRILIQILAIAAFIPLLIAAPISIVALYMFKVITSTVDTLNDIVKFDSLTGLLTRHCFLSSTEAARSKRGVMMLIDVDHFKSINDRFGHEQGDEVLRTMARILNQFSGPAMLAGRMGGEEFALYLQNVTVNQACMLAASIGTAFRNHVYSISGEQVIVTASFGLCSDNPSVPLRTILRQADMCLYEAKRTGRDRFVIDPASLPHKASQAS